MPMLSDKDIYIKYVKYLFVSVVVLHILCYCKTAFILILRV